jgi:hypothetical protein
MAPAAEPPISFRNCRLVSVIAIISESSLESTDFTDDTDLDFLNHPCLRATYLLSLDGPTPRTPILISEERIEVRVRLMPIQTFL